MKRLVIGDIHGCYAELQELLGKAEISASDEIISLGDLVDRGPESPEVLGFFRSQPNARSLQGNHERKHFRSQAGEIRPALSQEISRRQIGDAGYPDACAYMRSLERMIELPEAILVHGFFEPGVAPSNQRDAVVVGTLSGERYLRKHYDRPWYELYDGEKPIIVGHLNYGRKGQPLIWQDRVFAIDTGCCRGGRLTGILLPDFQIVSVPSRADHWPAVRRKYADVVLKGVPDDAIPWEEQPTRL